jgi:hypothetical protein
MYNSTSVRRNESLKELQKPGSKKSLIKLGNKFTYK